LIPDARDAGIAAEVPRAANPVVGRKAGNPQSAPLDVTMKLPYSTGCSGGRSDPVFQLRPIDAVENVRQRQFELPPSGEQLFKICEKRQASLSGAEGRGLR